MEGSSLYFEIPNDKEVRVRLIEAVPDSFWQISARLQVPKHLSVSGMVAEGTGFKISPGSRQPLKLLAGKGTNEPDIMSIVVGNKMPEFVAIETSYLTPLGYERSVMIGLLRKGYRGTIGFEFAVSRGEYHDIRASCEMALQPWQGAPIAAPELGNQPPRLKLAWDERSGGGRSLVEPIEAVCRALGLKEYNPAERAAA